MVLQCLLTPVGAQTLYDGSLGTFPAQQGWGYAAFPGQAVQSMVQEAVRLSTWATATEQAGYARAATAALNRDTGFTLLFSVKLELEAHANRDRAGFSVILLAQDKRGIELGFWADAVFAQSDAPLFTHAEDVAMDTTSAFVDYALTITRDRYQLRANAEVVLEGSVRDYTPFSGIIDPYETPNFIFLGDDTTSARATVTIRRVVLVPPPVLRIAADGVLAWAGITSVPYTVQGSSNLADWMPLTTVTSATGQFALTNALTARAEFWRVIGP